MLTVGGVQTGHRALKEEVGPLETRVKYHNLDFKSCPMRTCAAILPHRIPQRSTSQFPRHIPLCMAAPVYQPMTTLYPCLASDYRPEKTWSMNYSNSLDLEGRGAHHTATSDI